MDKARGLASAAGYDPRLDPMESVVMSILVELEKEIEELRKKIEELEKRERVRLVPHHFRGKEDF
jgi:hypothetical protein